MFLIVHQLEDGVHHSRHVRSDCILDDVLPDQVFHPDGRLQLHARFRVLQTLQEAEDRFDHVIIVLLC